MDKVPSIDYIMNCTNLLKLWTKVNDYCTLFNPYYEGYKISFAGAFFIGKKKLTKNNCIVYPQCNHGGSTLKDFTPQHPIGWPWQAKTPPWCHLIILSQEDTVSVSTWPHNHYQDITVFTTLKLTFNSVIDLNTWLFSVHKCDTYVWFISCFHTLRHS